MPPAENPARRLGTLFPRLFNKKPQIALNGRIIERILECKRIRYFENPSFYVDVNFTKANNSAMVAGT